MKSDGPVPGFELGKGNSKAASGSNVAEFRRIPFLGVQTMPDGNYSSTTPQKKGNARELQNKNKNARHKRGKRREAHALKTHSSAARTNDSLSASA